MSDSDFLFDILKQILDKGHIDKGSHYVDPSWNIPIELKWKIEALFQEEVNKRVNNE